MVLEAIFEIRIDDGWSLPKTFLFIDPPCTSFTLNAIKHNLAVTTGDGILFRLSEIVENTRPLLFHLLEHRLMFSPRVLSER
jgi:hypothetical protein